MTLLIIDKQYYGILRRYDWSMPQRCNFIIKIYVIWPKCHVM